jgi:hypothetical protein
MGEAKRWREFGEPPRGPRREMVAIRDLAGIMCGWAGCETTGEGIDRAPEGWRTLVVSKYSLLKPSGVLNAEVDMMLCPKHVAMLKAFLKPLVGPGEIGALRLPLP